jgi:hypothetical protein
MRFGLQPVVVTILLACLLPRALPAGEPWSFQDEVYHVYASSLNLQEMKSAGITLVSHIPCTKEYFDQAHALGLRVAPYVSLYKVVDLSEWPAGSVHPFWRELDLVQHPGWAMMAADGTRRRPFDSPDYRRGAHQSCCNAPGIAEGYVRGVKALMDLGADGIFVDNVHPSTTCYGVERGLAGHQHLFADKNNAAMYRVALAEVYRAVKSYGDDKVVILNGVAEYKDLADAMMWESYIGKHWSRQRDPDWKGVLSGAAAWAGYLRSGKAVAGLTYLWGITPYGEIDDAHYSYACAKLSGFNWTASSGHWAASLYPEFGPGATDWSATTVRNDVLRILYRARPGKALGPLEERNGLTTRLFEQALVAVNPTQAPITAELPLPPQCVEPTDLYSGALLRSQGGTVTATIPPEAGRVVLSRRAVAASFIEEIRLSAAEVRRRDGGPPEGPRVEPRTQEALGQIEKLAEQAAAALDDKAAATRLLAAAVPLLEQLVAPPEPEKRGSDPFNPETTMAQQVQNVQRYVPRALGVLSGVEFVATGPREQRLGAGPTAVELRLVPYDVQLADSPAAFSVELPPGWTMAPAEAAREAHAASFLLTPPAGVRKVYQLGARALVRLADGTPVVLQTELQAPVDSPSAPLPVIQAGRVARAPVLDGVLDDACWQEAAQGSGFVNFQTAEPVTRQTVARLLWDAEALYVAFDCREPQMEAMRANVKPDGRETEGQILQDDCVLVYLDTAAKGAACVQFAVNALGAHQSRAGIPFDAATSRRGDGWSAELRLPFAKLGAPPPAGGAWGINFYRNQWWLGEFSAWSCTYGPYSSPKRFGVVRFAP